MSGLVAAAPARARSARGQALIEFTMLVPVFLMLLTGLLEFGMVFAHHLTLEYGTREGARAGAALGDGSGDSSVVRDDRSADRGAPSSASHRAGLTGRSSAEVSQISIWQSDAVGAPMAGQVNVWSYTGPGTGPTVDGAALRFSRDRHRLVAVLADPRARRATRSA